MFPSLVFYPKTPTYILCINPHSFLNQNVYSSHCNAKTLLLDLVIGSAKRGFQGWNVPVERGWDTWGPLLLEEFGHLPQTPNFHMLMDCGDIDVPTLRFPSSKFRVIRNSVSLAKGKSHAKKLFENFFGENRGVVLMAVGPQGPGKTFEQKKDLLNLLWDLAKETGYSNENIIFDCALFPFVVDNNPHLFLFQETLKTVKWVKLTYPGSQTVLGVSNAVYRLDPTLFEHIQIKVVTRALNSGLDWALLGTPNK